MEWVTSATVILVKSEFVQDVIGIVFNTYIIIEIEKEKITSRLKTLFNTS